MQNVKALVSKNKKRFVDEENGFNLDLSYIGSPTPRIIAMGFPASGVEAMYRNPIGEVQRFFEMYHKDNYSVYNLCLEHRYDISQFFARCSRFGFDDHCPPPLDMIQPFCQITSEWLNADLNHVAAIHCKVNKYSVFEILHLFHIVF